MTRYVFQICLLAVAVLYAIQRGGRPEKSVALIITLMIGVDVPLHWATGSLGRYDAINLGHLIIDFSTFAALLIVAIKSNRIWTLWAASAQLVALGAHLLRWLEIEMEPRSYAVITRAPSYLLIILLIVGTGLRSRRSAKASEK